MGESTTIVFAGGGTGGHLYPGIAVAEALQSLAPHVTALFLCTEKEIDRIILGPTGFEFITQPIIPWKKSISGTLRFARAFGNTWDLVRKLLRDRKPAAVLGLGGYAAGLPVKLAARRGIHTAILNPDVIPGEANQLLMKPANVVCCQFEQTAEHVASSLRPKLRVTGCPIRAAIRDLPSRSAGITRLGLDPLLQTLVVTGASLGALTVNEAVLEMFKSLPMQGWQVLHLCGRDHAQSVRFAYSKLPIRSMVIDFTPAMADVWAVADLAISRSGASSCAELTATGVPSILMPYPFHKDLHQRANAKVLAEAGAAVLLEDQQEAIKNAPQLRQAIEPLLADRQRRRQMSDAARRLAKAHAAEEVGRLLLNSV